ncbi:MAG: LacI family transcriptional regulator [Clostridiales bacterium]|nr:LacI family transcriptional regulator [Clostridiales bacterium]
MAATIHDVARLAGVNSSTVSRVLNGKATVMEETREKIYAAMRQLDYHPNSLARSLANGQSGAIGVVVDAEDAEAFSNVFFNRSLFAVEKVAQERGYHVILANGARHAGGMGSIEKLMLERKVDGLILPPSTVKPTLLKKIQSFPCVVLGQPETVHHDVSWVDVNNAQGAEMGVAHLLEHGYRRVAYLGGQGRTGFSKRRVKGYEKALEKQDPLVFPTDGTVEGAERTALEALGAAGRPDAFLCNDNLTAFGLLKATRTMNLRVPQDVGIVTFDNYPLAEYTDPPLTAVDVDTALLGEQAARLLFQHIDHHTPSQQVLLGTTLIDRISSCRM